MERVGKGVVSCVMVVTPAGNLDDQARYDRILWIVDRGSMPANKRPIIRNQSNFGFAQRNKNILLVRE